MSEPKPFTDEIREQLADYAHEAWSGWMKHLFRLSVKLWDGRVAIPVELVERWKIQMNIDYKDLPEDMKPSDRKEADRMIAIVQPTIAADRKRIEEMFEIGRGQEAEIIELQSRLERMEGALEKIAKPQQSPGSGQGMLLRELIGKVKIATEALEGGK